jgi:hypothetical protein
LQIDESRRQFNKIQGLLRPYVGAGNVALRAQLDLMGIGGTAAFTPKIEEFTAGGTPGTAGGTGGFGDWAMGAVDGLLGNGAIPKPSVPGVPGVTKFRVQGKEFATRADAEAYANANARAGMTADQAQRAAIAKIANGAQFKALSNQGEYGLLANAAATGGLRGGDTAAALAQFRPQMLQSLIDRQLANLGGVAANGQNAAGQTGAAAMNTAGMVNAAYGDAGAAQAGRALAQGKAWSNAGAGILNTLGEKWGSGWGFGGGQINSSPIPPANPF